MFIVSIYVNRNDALDSETTTDRAVTLRDEAHQTTSQLRSGVIELRPEPRLDGVLHAVLEATAEDLRARSELDLCEWI